jgi:hypothetical protein
MRGYDTDKNVSGRKRHVLVDTLGLVLLVIITAANVHDRTAARILLGTLGTRFRRLRIVWVDGAYARRPAALDSATPATGQGPAGNHPQAQRRAWLCGSAMALDCGAYVRMAGPMAMAEGRLRVFVTNYRDAHPVWSRDSERVLNPRLEKMQAG